MIFTLSTGGGSNGKNEDREALVRRTILTQLLCELEGASGSANPTIPINTRQGHLRLAEMQSMSRNRHSAPRRCQGPCLPRIFRKSWPSEVLSTFRCRTPLRLSTLAIRSDMQSLPHLANNLPVERAAGSRRAGSTRRKTAVVACNTCRSRRTRCGGQRPVCTFCRARGLDCQYEKAATPSPSKYAPFQL